MVRKVRLVVAVLSLGAWLVVGTTTPAHAAETVSPSSRSFAYDAGPFTNLNVGGLVGAGCFVPQGCDDHDFTVQVPDGYYDGLRAAGKIGVVRIAASWQDNANDFDLTLLNDKGSAIASSGFGNSDFERITYAELPSGKYTVEMAVFRAANASFH